ncbi:hypothetical protein HQ544_02330 [Candidatus Falkowbacteria bacterium]|nr:hypothetical protein [Candidatus Falkowbacteria bacterium]
MPITNEQLEKLLQDNTRKTEEVYEICKKVKKHLLIGQIMGIVRILLVVVPLILAIIYLPSLLKPYLDQYNDLMGGGGSIMDQFRELQGLK